MQAVQNANALKSTGRNGQYYVIVAISLFFMFFFGPIVPSFAGITEMGTNILGIFLGVLIATIATNETFWPSIMGLFAMVILGYSSAGGVLGAWFGNPVIQQIIWVMALTGALTESGAVDVLGRKVLRMKGLQGHPMRLILVLFFTVLVCAALVSSPTTMLLLWYPILDGICKMCGITKEDPIKRQLALGIYISAMGAYILPFKGIHLSSIAIISGIMDSAGLQFNDAVYLVTASIIVVVFVLGYAFFMKFVWKTDLSALKEFSIEKMNLKEEDFKLTSRQIIILVFMLIGIVFLLASMVLPKGGAITAFYKKIGSVWIWILLFGILSLARTKDGKPFINGAKLLQSKTMWGIVAVAGLFTIAGRAIASDELGIRDAIAHGLGPILDTASWPILVIVCVTLSTIFTNITNGMPVSFTINAIGIPLACTLQMEGRGNATVLGAATILSGLCAFLTYGSIIYASLFLGREEVTRKFVFTKGVVTNIIFIVICSLISIGCGYLFS